MNTKALTPRQRTTSRRTRLGVQHYHYFHYYHYCWMLLSLTGCFVRADIQYVTSFLFYQNMQDGFYDVIVDAQSKKDYEKAHLVDATWIEDLDKIKKDNELDEALALLEGCQYCHVAVYSKTAGKAMKAALTLQSRGFVNLYNVLGMDDYLSAGLHWGVREGAAESVVVPACHADPEVSLACRRAEGITEAPTTIGSAVPSALPSLWPSVPPSPVPTARPTVAGSSAPSTSQPSAAPSTSMPSSAPSTPRPTTGAPTTAAPTTETPTLWPSVTPTTPLPSLAPSVIEPLVSINSPAPSTENDVPPKKMLPDNDDKDANKLFGNFNFDADQGNLQRQRKRRLVRGGGGAVAAKSQQTERQQDRQ